MIPFDLALIVNQKVFYAKKLITPMPPFIEFKGSGLANEKCKIAPRTRKKE